MIATLDVVQLFCEHQKTKFVVSFATSNNLLFPSVELLLDNLNFYFACFFPTTPTTTHIYFCYNNQFIFTTMILTTLNNKRYNIREQI